MTAEDTFLTKRHTLFPIEHPLLYEYVNKAESSFWTSLEIDFNQDLISYSKLNDRERTYLNSVLGFFAASDSIVNDNIALNLLRYSTVPEACHFYALQLGIEAVHSKVYSLLLNTYIQDSTERNALLASLDTNAYIRGKAQWVGRVVGLEHPGLENLVPSALAFVAMEGIFFSSSFAMIYWLRERGEFPALTCANELIARDEGLHMEFGIDYLSSVLYPNKSFQYLESVKRLLMEACNIECLFVMDSMRGGSMLGMNAELMCQYVQYVTDYIGQRLGCGTIYGVKNPFVFMNRLGMEKKTNFFETRPTQYQTLPKSSGTENIFD